MGATAINWTELAALYLLLLLPALLFRVFQLELGKDLLISTARMTAQLLLVGVYLGFLFRLDNSFLNLLWFLIMLVTAALAVVGRTKLSRRALLPPALLGLLLGCCVTLPALLLTVNAEPFLGSRFLIPITGMLLGNAMGANVIALERLFDDLANQQELYEARLALGATVEQALRPFQQAALRAAFSPQLAGMATLGLVTLPGMMTGQLLSGTDPITAIQYQLAIMVGIFTCLVLASWGATSLALRRLVDKSGRVKVAIASQEAGQH